MAELLDELSSLREILIMGSKNDEKIEFFRFHNFQLELVGLHALGVSRAETRLTVYCSLYIDEHAVAKIRVLGQKFMRFENVFEARQ